MLTLVGGGNRIQVTVNRIWQRKKNLEMKVLCTVGRQRRK